MTKSARTLPHPKVTESEIKAALSAADRASRGDPRFRKAQLSDAQARRRETQKFLTSYLKKTGFDFATHDKIHVQSQSALQRLLPVRGQELLGLACERARRLCLARAWRLRATAPRRANVASFLALNGSCEAGADGGTAGIFPGDTSSLQLQAFLNVWQWWGAAADPGLPRGHTTA
jgi:hypothetical protein